MKLCVWIFVVCVTTISLSNALATGQRPPFPDDVDKVPKEPELVEQLEGTEEKIAGMPPLPNEEDKTPNSRKKRMVVTDRLWTSGKVPFILNKVVADDPHRVQHIKNGMRAYERFTCFRFLPWQNSTGDHDTTNKMLKLGHNGFLHFKVENKCWATQGNTNNSKGQTVSCCAGYTCIHELGHALGAYHEQQNPKSVGFIRTNAKNIQDGYRRYFSFRDGALSLAYDLQSVMHYNTYMFQKGHDETITPLVKDLPILTYDYYYLMAELSTSHNCGGIYCKDFGMTCENDGYLTLVEGKCACRCPRHLDPDTGCKTILKQTSSVYPTAWPKGSYGLPTPKKGCPSTLFKKGFRTHFSKSPDCQDLAEHCVWWASQGYCTSYADWMKTNCKKSCKFCPKGLSFKSDNSQMDDKVNVGSVVIRMFCVKEDDTSLTVEDEKWNWPSGGGDYCIYRKGGKCPKGFESGHATFTGVKQGQNSAYGKMPDGKYGEKTKMEFCCRSEADLGTDPLKFPIKPFALMKKGDSKCPKVDGMHFTEEVIAFQNSGTMFFDGEHPIKKVNDYHNIWGIYYCVYNPVKSDCGGVIDLTTSEPTFELSSSADNNDRLCTWLFKGPPGTRIAFDIPESSFKRNGRGECIDSLQLNYFNIGSRPKVHCSDKFDKSFTTIKNTLMVTYETYDQGKNPSSFKAKATLIHDGNLCYSMKDNGASYAGKVSVTRNLKTCLPWSTTTKCPFSTLRPGDVTSYLDSNYCRNPGAGLRPWCYTDINGCKREYCDVCGIERPLTAYKKGKVQSKSTKQAPASSITCGTPSAVSDGKVLEEVKTSYQLGDKVTCQCTGTTKSTATRTCLTTGEWSPLDKVCTGCQPGFVLYEGKCYKYIEEAAHGQNAGKVCKDLGAMITPPKTKEDNEALLFLRSYTDDIWLGASDAAKEGDWVLEDGTKLDSGYTNWAEGKPDNWSGVSDYLSQNVDGLWSDAYGKWGKKFFCQHEPLN